jgi:hypothetical protein
MRSTLLLSIFAIGLIGCHDHGIPMGGDDMTAANDDMSVGMDMSMIPDDFRKDVSYTMFAMDLAQALCAHYLACGQLDAAQMPQCIERNLRHTGWDQDVEITKGRMSINELQCLAALNSARCDFSDSGAWSTRCLQFLYTGHQQNGQTCIAAAECVSGFCQHAGSDGGMSEQVTGCPGVCGQLAVQPDYAPVREAGRAQRRVRRDAVPVRSHVPDVPVDDAAQVRHPRDADDAARRVRSAARRAHDDADLRRRHVLQADLRRFDDGVPGDR